MADTKELIKKLAQKHGTERQSLIPILHGIVEQENYLTRDAMLEVAQVLDIAAAEVYGTASFYSFLETKPKGKYVVRVCKSISCDMKGKKQIIDALEDMLKIKLGETTEDNRFSLLETNCIGLCDEGPAMLINDDYFTKLTPEKIREVLGEFIRNKF